MSLSLLFDGLDDVYDVAFLLSADTDQVATARVFAERLAPTGKQFIGIAPMDRRPPAGYSQFGFIDLTISRYQLECCVMPEQIQGPNKMIVRPAEYAPPAEWIHPDQRPKDKPPKPPKVWAKGVKG